MSSPPPARQRIDPWALLIVLGVASLVPAAARAAFDVPPSAAVAAVPCTGLLGGEKLDLSTATPEELELLPGIGPVAARRLVEARPFAGWEQVAQVKGIGPAKAARLSAYAVLRRPSPPLGRPGR